MLKNTQGRLRLDFKSTGASTYLASQYYQLPLQVLPPYYGDEDGTAFVYILNPSGGVMQGDRFHIQITLEKDCRVLLTSTSANKFYKMEEDHAEIYTHCTLGEKAVLEYLPDHNVPFHGSDTRQVNLFELSSSSILMVWDIVTGGRKSRGELFQYKNYSSKTKISKNGELILFDNINLIPGEMDVSSLGIMEGHDSIASIFMYKESLDMSVKEEVGRIIKEENLRGGISIVNKDLAVIRLLSDNIMRLRDAMDRIWDPCRIMLLGKESVSIRKY